MAVPDAKQLRAECLCKCGVQVELWIPPTVVCPACGAIYVWQAGPLVQCLAAPDGSGHLAGLLSVNLLARDEQVAPDAVRDA